jgi:hypothetical protein
MSLISQSNDNEIQDRIELTEIQNSFIDFANRKYSAMDEPINIMEDSNLNSSINNQNSLLTNYSTDY